ncbi:hypothetical protein CCL07_08660 [Pseudomonas congelans]|uniref:hypothetical protein n=1 Tax=Pseudomonas congelans TaxID=200452 RepID=UPI000BB659F7|nr:hypothetical protein [Pseudomonas congelans]PBQ07827.1 hypothetical protein CCL07_08660 [Pseudomonas congelans]
MTCVQVNHDFIKFIDPDLFADILNKGDDGVCVIRLQMICERFLIIYLKERISSENIEFFVSGKGKSAEILRHFNERLTTSIASGLPAELARALKHINKIRNHFAHDLDHKIMVSDMDKYFKLVDLFKVDVGIIHGYEGPVRDAKISSDGKLVNAVDDFQAGFTIATCFLMTKAGLWLANDLQKRGQLSLGEPLQ